MHSPSVDKSQVGYVQPISLLFKVNCFNILLSFFQQSGNLHHPYNRQSREERLRNIQRRLGLNPDTGKPVASRTAGTTPTAAGAAAALGLGAGAAAAAALGLGAGAATANQTSKPAVPSRLGSNAFSFAMKQRSLASTYRRRQKSSSSGDDSTTKTASLISQHPPTSAGVTSQLPLPEEDSKQYLCRRLLNSPAESAYSQPEVVTGQHLMHTSSGQQQPTTHDSQATETSEVAHQTHDEGTQFGHHVSMNRSPEETGNTTSHVEPKRKEQESASRPAEQMELISVPPSSVHSTVYVTPSEDESQFTAVQHTTSNSYQLQSSHQHQFDQQPKQAHQQQRLYQQQMYQHPHQAGQQQQLYHQQQQATQQQKSYHHHQQTSQQQQPLDEQARQLSSEKARHDVADNSWVG